MLRVEMRTGNQLVDQFNSGYMALAFPFLFPHGTARPDVVNHCRQQQVHEGNPAIVWADRQRGPIKVPIMEWAACMQRRVEAQFRRDWTFLFTVWNYLFRTLVNLQKNTYMFAVPNEAGPGLRMLTSAEIGKAAMELYEALQKGKYVDCSGARKAINGDLSKLRHVPNLSSEAKRLLSEMEARSRNVPGTHEVRKTMRHHTHANRVQYGTSIFVTFSPSERDSTLMLRLCRGRKSDPAFTHESRRAQDLQGRCEPKLEEELLHLDPMALAEHVLDYDERVALLARDPVACSDGFDVLVLLTLKHLFGVRYCPDCPNCAKSHRPCTDVFGSNATAMGGIFGRIDAVYGSIERQKSGTRHGHFQLFLQCRHQHTPLQELLQRGPQYLQGLLAKCKAYTTHVQRAVYTDPSAWQEEVRPFVEEEWPEYRHSAVMVSRPAYQLDVDMSATEWKRAFLSQDVEQLQQRKQHHVHLPIGPDGKRMPLAHCRDRKDLAKCTGGFPKERQLAEEAWLVCPALAAEAGLPFKGKRNAVGLVAPPRNDPDVNSNHPALLVGLRCNGDVQLPYRFPCLEAIHEPRCPGTCHEDFAARGLVAAGQRNMAAKRWTANFDSEAFKAVENTPTRH